MSSTVAADDSDSDDDFGPTPAAPTADDDAAAEQPRKKKARRLEFENLYLENLPLANYYERSYMHRDFVTHVAVSKAAEFIITGSTDGHVKFWKKMLDSIEFVKHFQAHLGPINAFVVSPDEKFLVTTSQDKTIKFFDIVGFDMANMIAVPSYEPTCAIWLNSKSNMGDKVAVGDKDSGLIRVYKAGGSGQTPVNTIEMHAAPVKCMALNIKANIAVSADAKGLIEYWDTRTLAPPAGSNSSKGAVVNNNNNNNNTTNDRFAVRFQFKTETDLYELAKAKTVPCCIAVSPTGKTFSLLSTDKRIRIFNFARGKLFRVYDESAKGYADSSKAAATAATAGAGAAAGGGGVMAIDSLELGRRLAVERELEASPETLALCNIIYDESGNFLVFGSLKGIKIINILTNNVSRIVGSGETVERFLFVALYQGIPKVDQQLLLSRANSAADRAGTSVAAAMAAAAASSAMTRTMDQKAELLADPTIFATSFKRRRFYCFSRREPKEQMGTLHDDSDARDVLNEMPTEEERNAMGADGSGAGGAAGDHSQKQGKSGNSEVVLRTNMGEIVIKLFVKECPRTVENFTTHVRNGYYNNLLFHRVIKGFMLQTGDPLGNGTGGESIWGHEFEDEFVKTLRHDRPFTVSMANAGPNTNGSQFFITTVPTPWLDNKHTVFGRVTKGFEVATKIENLRVNKQDKPYNDVKILSAEVL